MHVFHKQLDLEEGFILGNVAPCRLIMDGSRFSACSGFDLFLSLRAKTIACWNCGCVADRWISMSHPSDKNSPPVLNLFSMKVHNQALGIMVPVMMTRDHIIPKSLGGVDRVANLRPGCSTCNAKRGSKMPDEDLAFMKAHPELVSAARVKAHEIRQAKHGKATGPNKQKR